MRGKVRSACVFAALLGLVFLVGCSGGSDEKKVTGGTPATPVPTVSLPGPRPGDTNPVKPPGDPAPLAVTAKQFSEEYNANKQSFLEKYKDRPIEITGLFIQYGEDPIAEKTILFLRGKDERDEVTCRMKEPDFWKKALPGQTVKLRGTGPDIDFQARVDNCTILEVTGPGPKTYTADELSKLRASDDKLVLKMQSQYLFVSGEIVTIGKSSEGDTLITLKTQESMPPVLVEVGSKAKPLLANLKEGQKVKILCGGMTPSAGGKGVMLFARKEKFETLP